MTPQPPITSSKPNRLGNFLYNVDRAIASLMWGTAQETISSEVGRVSRGQWAPRWGKGALVKLANWLDTTPSIWGVDHTSRAIIHADKLDAVDNGMEQ